jgi:drug/metabolite transporter (DMT)-like permease
MRSTIPQNRASGFTGEPVAVGAVLFSTAPLFALPLGVMFLGERVSAGTVLGALVAVAGIVVPQL